MEEPAWLEVSLTVDGEMAEAVADVLRRFAPNGVAIESTAVASDPLDLEGHPVGPLRVAAYLRMHAGVEETRRKLEEALWYLGRIRPLPGAEYRVVKEVDWAEAWKEHYHPIPVAEKLVIVPAWLEPPAGDRIAIRIDPGMAFGTGTHPTTRLCLELVEGILRSDILRSAQDDKGMAEDDRMGTVIDLGCGSGILSVAALKLGARGALGVDIDPDAIRVAGENAELNQVADRFEAGLGSLDEIRAGAFSLQQAGLVLANILAPVLVRMLDEGLGELVSPGGALVLSGIIDEQVGEVIAAAERNGLRLVDQKQDGDWVAIRFAKRRGTNTDMGDRGY